jgi:hypothetical protein
MSGDQTYGLWPLVLLNTGVLIIFAASFFHPRSGRDWRAMGAFSAFLVALFTEMYGVPLTVYLLSGWLGDRIPALEATHAGGHLWNDLIGWTGDPHLSPFHLASYLAIGGGFWADGGGLAGAVGGRPQPPAAHQRRLCTGPPSPVRGVAAGHGGVPAAMAHHPHVGDVPGADGGVPAPGAGRGTRGRCPLRPRVGRLRSPHPSVPALAKPQNTGRRARDQRPTAPTCTPGRGSAIGGVT